MKKLLMVLMLGAMGTAFGQNKAAVINSQQILDTMASYQQALVSYMEYEKSAMDELAQLEKEIKALYLGLTGPESQTKPPLVLEQDQKKFERKQQEYQQKEYYLQMELQQYGQKLQAASFETLSNAVKKVCKDLKYDYAMDATNLIYFNESFDITEQVKKEVWAVEEANGVKYPEIKPNVTTVDPTGGQ